MIQDYVVLTGINIVLAWSVYIILLSGSLSFANGGFMAMGAYASSVLTVNFGFPLILAAITAAIGTGIFGCLIGFPALRTRGIYLILLTTGVAVLVQSAIESIPYIGAIQGFGGMSGTQPWHIVVLVLVVGAALWLISHSSLQRTLETVREDELVANSLGMHVVYIKLVCFGVGAGIAALAGSYYAHYMLFISPDQFGIVTSVFIVLYVVLGGTNNMWGPVLGATIMTLLPELARGLGSWRPTAFGVVILLLLLIRPEGLLSFRRVTVKRQDAEPWNSGPNPAGQGDA
ncbi:MAG: branched-chain amino acid ABC transporter permease [Burkholderiaceae bacterium]|nr:MAG: branched-chain amino acid ABC transporter permease [Burkholderiaceae bacterium]TAM04180.1 MAG: branched-chain amino acid ABC transporter permease [Pusillimonas sp.]